MDLADLHSFFENSPAIRLLRADHAPFILHFFSRVFKESDEIAVDHEHLLAEFTEYQDAIQETYPGVLAGPATNHLTDWCGDQKRYLHRFYQDGPLPYYQLTPAAESVLRYVQESLERQARVAGTESRIRTIIEKLRDICTYASGDLDKRLEALRAERDRVQDEIDRLMETGVAKPHHDARLREDFHLAIDLLRWVLSDFRKVEEDFRKITREVQQRHVDGALSKGGLLGYVLDEEDALRDSDAGVSFYEFRNQFFSPKYQEYVRELIAEVRQIAALAENERGRQALRLMMPSLAAQANQVIKTIQRLSGTIRRFLDTRVAAERRQLTELITEIQQLALKCGQLESAPDVEVEIELKPEVYTPMSREAWIAPPALEALKLKPGEDAPEGMQEAFADFVRLRRLDWEKMRGRIGDLTRLHDAISLPRLLQEHPPQSGAVEVLAYVQIAKEDGHIVKPEEEEDIQLENRVLTIPRVIFRKIGRP